MLAFAQGHFGGLAFGDVHDRRKHHRPVVGFDGIQSDLDRELASVFPSAKKIAPDPHRSWLRIGVIRLAQAGMMAGESFGHEKLHRSPEELRPRISKNAFCLGVDQDDLAPPSDHHHGVGGRFDDEPKKAVSERVLLCRAQRSRAFSHGLTRIFGTDWIENRPDRPRGLLWCECYLMEGLWASAAGAMFLKTLPLPGSNSTCRFVEFRPLMSRAL